MTTIFGSVEATQPNDGGFFGVPEPATVGAILAGSSSLFEAAKQPSSATSSGRQASDQRGQFTTGGFQIGGNATPQLIPVPTGPVQGFTSMQAPLSSLFTNPAVVIAAIAVLGGLAIWATRK